MTWRRIELATDRLAVMPGPLHERLAGLFATLQVLSASDFPTPELGMQWEAIRAAFFQFDIGPACFSADQAAEVAYALLDLRAEIRRWVIREVELPESPAINC